MHPCTLRPRAPQVRKSLHEYGVRVTVHGARDEARKQSSASDLLAYLRLAVAPADDAALLTALAVPARGFGAGGVAVKYLKQAAAQRGGVGALLAAAQVHCLCLCTKTLLSPATVWKGLVEGATLCVHMR